jgi:hypothetical protein
MKITNDFTIVTAAYEDKAHPGVKNWWNTVRQKDHPFAKHPLMALHGESLAQQSYAYTEGRAEKQNAQLGMQGLQGMQQTVMQILQYEKGHKKELEAAAINIVSKTYGISPEKLRAELMPLGGVGGGMPPRRPTSRAQPHPDPEVRDQANKRMTINSLTQGAAIHGFQTAHHLAKDVLDSINPQLRGLYDKLSATSHGAYYWIDPEQMQAMGGGMRAGEVKLVRENDQIIVHARATTLPVLIQELIKGTMELLGLHGISNLDKATHQHVMERSDDPADEHFHIQMGPALWRKLLTVLPKGSHMNMGSVISKLYKLPPNQLHAIMDAVVDDLPIAKELLSQLLT